MSSTVCKLGCSAEAASVAVVGPSAEPAVAVVVDVLSVSAELMAAFLSCHTTN